MIKFITIRNGILLFSIIAMLSGCIFSSESKKKKNPEILKVSISDGVIITSRDLTITWQGNEYARLYQYTIDEEVSEWSDTTSVEITDLDEAEHIFTLQARKDSVFSSLTTIHFTVDAITGPGIILSPRKIKEASLVTLSLENVDSLMAAHIEIVCEDRAAAISGFVLSEFTGEEGSMVYFTDNKIISRLILDIGFTGVKEGVSGRITIGSFLVTPLRSTGEVTINSEKTEFRNIHNSPIELNGLDMVRIGK
ncbi:hypothetical protein ACFL5B_03120 [Candidatus Latescibacterota bacterium]